MSTATTADAEFTEFVRRVSPSLGRTAWLLTGNRDAAADLVQATLVKTYVAWRRVAPGTAEAYARRILVNENIDRWRRRHGEVVGVPDEPASPGFEARVADREHVRRMLAALPMQQRRVVVLRYYEDLTEQQTADLLGIAVGTEKSTAHKALAALKRQLVTGRGTAMNELELVLREQLRAADDVHVPLDPEAVLRAGRRARRTRTAIIAAVAILVLAVAAWLAPMFGRLVSGGDVDAVPDPRQTPQHTAPVTPSPTPSVTPSVTPTAGPGVTGSVTLQVPGDSDPVSSDDELTATGDGTAVSVAHDGSAPVRVPVPVTPGSATVHVGYPDEAWAVLVINGEASWVAGTAPSMWGADAEVLPGSTVTVAAVRLFYLDEQWKPADQFLWGTPDGKVFLVAGTPSTTTPLDSAVFPSVLGSQAVYAHDAAADLWLRRDGDAGASVSRPSDHPGQVPTSLAGSADGTEFEVVALLPEGVDATTATFRARNGTPKGDPDTAQLAERTLVRQVFTASDPNDLQPDAEITFTHEGKPVTQPIANW